MVSSGGHVCAQRAAMCGLVQGGQDAGGGGFATHSDGPPSAGAARRNCFDSSIDMVTTAVLGGRSSAGRRTVSARYRNAKGGAVCLTTSGAGLMPFQVRREDRTGPYITTSRRSQTKRGQRVTHWPSFHLSSAPRRRQGWRTERLSRLRPQWHFIARRSYGGRREMVTRPG